MGKRKPVRRIPSVGDAARKFKAAFSQSKQFRERVVSFGVSCCLHVLLMLGLSLIAISTGAVSSPMMLIAAPSVGEDESTLSPEPDWFVEPELPMNTTTDRPIEFDLTDVEVSTARLASATSSEVSATPVAASTGEKLNAQSRPGKSVGSDLDGMQALAAAGIQSRVTKAGGKKGEVQFALAWRNVNDLDLHVIAPSGEHISHQHRRSKCFGMLDVDMNVDGESEEPVENVRWLRNAPWGRYTILVNFFKLNSEGVRRPRRQNPYQLLVQLGGESLMREAVAGFGDKQVTVWRFLYVPDTFSSIQREQMLRELNGLQSREESIASPMLDQARAAQGTVRQRMLQSIVQQYPHTDAAIEALQLMEGEVVKRSGSQR